MQGPGQEEQEAEEAEGLKPEEAGGSEAPQFPEQDMQERVIPPGGGDLPGGACVDDSCHRNSFHMLAISAADERIN
jgi:hypothetical protein